MEDIFQGSSVLIGFGCMELRRRILCTVLKGACWWHACRWVFRVNMPASVRIKLVDALADTEHRLAFGTSERLQLGALVGAFSVAREGIVAAAK